MSRQQNLQKLLATHYRRLQKLREQQAVDGRLTDPATLIEIEDIEAEIKKLQIEMGTSTDGQDTEPKSANPVKVGPWHVLVVDDDASWQTRLKRILRRTNCTVVTASTYMEAEAELTNSDLDLVTIDLNLDQTTEYADGLELASQIREKFGPSFPIIIITGKGDLSRQRRAFRDYNVIDFLEKARFDFEEFMAVVREALADH